MNWYALGQSVGMWVRHWWVGVVLVGLALLISVGTALGVFWQRAGRPRP